jgi:ankyrin repeat protein
MLDAYVDSVQYTVQTAINKALQVNNQQYSFKDEDSTVNDAGMVSLSHEDLYIECSRQYKASILSRHINNLPEAATKADDKGFLPLHRWLSNRFSTADVRMLIERYPAAIGHRNDDGNLPLHLECMIQCRLSIILKCIELYPQALAKANREGQLPLHALLSNSSSSIKNALMLIEKYPAAIEYRNGDGNNPLHIECMNQCRSSIITKCIELYPQALAKANREGQLPLHVLLSSSSSSSIENALMMMERYPAALQHQDSDDNYPLHLECTNLCRSVIISKCIEVYSQALNEVDRDGNLPLHTLLKNVDAYSCDSALFVIEKYPTALQRRNNDGYLPLHIECKAKCRPAIISKCIELYPQALDNQAISFVIYHTCHSRWSMMFFYRNFHRGSPVLSIIFTSRPMSLYDRHTFVEDDIRDDPYSRRRILNLLPHHVFTPTHESDYRDLNWKPRAAMITLLSQINIKIQHGSNAAMLVESLLAQPGILVDHIDDAIGSSK